MYTSRWLRRHAGLARCGPQVARPTGGDPHVPPSERSGVGSSSESRATSICVFRSPELTYPRHDLSGTAIGRTAPERHPFSTTPGRFSVNIPVPDRSCLGMFTGPVRSPSSVRKKRYCLLGLTVLTKNVRIQTPTEIMHPNGRMSL